MSDYLQNERARVIESLRKLITCLNIEMLDLSKTSLPLEVYSYLPENECFVHTGREISRIALENGKLNSSTLSTFSNQRYTSLFPFYIGGANYLAAGYSTGIELANLTETEENRCIEVKTDKNTLSGFHSLGIWSLSSEPYDCLLVAAHSDIGVIGVPLEELCGDGVVEINFNDPSQEKYRLYEKKKDDDHVRIAIAENRLYVAEGCELFTIAHKENKTAREGFVERYYHTYSQPITALGNEITTGTIYSATLGGDIFKKGELYYPTKLLTFVTKIIPGKYDKDDGVFYQGKINNNISPLFFSNGKKDRIVSPPGATVLDFFPRKEGLWMLTAEEVLFSGALGAVKVKLPKGGRLIC